MPDQDLEAYLAQETANWTKQSVRWVFGGTDEGRRNVSDHLTILTVHGYKQARTRQAGKDVEISFSLSGPSPLVPTAAPDTSKDKPSFWSRPENLWSFGIASVLNGVVLFGLVIVPQYGYTISAVGMILNIVLVAWLLRVFWRVIGRRILLWLFRYL